MKKVLVTGAGGQLSRELEEIHGGFEQFSFEFISHEQLDITDNTSVNQWFESNKPDICINCAAYTAVDKAETETQQAFAVNGAGAGNLARACKNNGAILIHISTDYVFDGASNKPYRETDTVNPLGIYGKSKLDGEMEVRESGGATIVIRTSWLYSSYGQNIVKTVLRLASERPAMNFVYDQVGSPTYAHDLAQAILQIISDGELSSKTGVYHYCNHGVCSWYDFARAIIDMKQLDCHLKPIETHEYPLPAKRPAYSVLNTGKLREAFHLEIPYWRDSLKNCLKKL